MRLFHLFASNSTSYDVAASLYGRVNSIAYRPKGCEPPFRGSRYFSYEMESSYSVGEDMFWRGFDAEVAKSTDPSFVIFTDDNVLDMAAKRQWNMQSSAKLLHPDPRLFQKIYLQEWGNRMGLPMPRQLNHDEVSCARVLKPLTAKNKLDLHRTTGQKVIILNSGEVRPKFANDKDYLVQELIDSEGRPQIVWTGFISDAHECTSYLFEIAASYPEANGRVAELVTIKNEQLQKLWDERFQKAGLTGIFNAQLMWSKSHQDYVLLEINPRLWMGFSAFMKLGGSLIEQALGLIDSRGVCVHGVWRSALYRLTSNTGSIMQDEYFKLSDDRIFVRLKVYCYSFLKLIFYWWKKNES